MISRTLSGRTTGLGLCAAAYSIRFPATVRHINAAGPQVKIELAAETGEPVRVEMQHDRFSWLELQVGELVFVSAREVNLFVDDYSI